MSVTTRRIASFILCPAFFDRSRRTSRTISCVWPKLLVTEETCCSLLADFGTSSQRARERRFCVTLLKGKQRRNAEMRCSNDIRDVSCS